MIWSNEKLGDYCVVIAGQSPEGKYYNNTGDGLPFYQGKKEFSDRYIGNPQKWTTKITKEAKDGDILMSVRAPVGPINFSTQDICIGRGLAAIRPSEKLDKDFLFYYLLSKQDEIKGNEGAVFASINKSQIETLSFSYVCLEEQKRIVAILDQAFADIEQVRAKTEQNLKNARELFESYLQQLFNSLGNNCELRSMSDKTMLSMIDGDRGKNYPKKSEFQAEGYCLFLSTKNVREDGFLFDSTMFIDKSRDRLLRKGKLDRNDVILTTRGTIGNLALYDKTVEYENIRINSGMLILRPNIEIILPSYLFEIMRSGIVRRQIEAKVSGAAQPQLPVNTLKTFSFPVPISLEEQKQVVETIKSIEITMNELTKIYENKLASLDELKKSILQKAFTGELTHADKEVESQGAAAIGGKLFVSL